MTFRYSKKPCNQCGCTDIIIKRKEEIDGSFEYGEYCTQCGNLLYARAK